MDFRWRILTPTLYNVFNLSQIDGLKNISATVESPATVSTPAENIIAFMPKRPEIKYGMSKAIIRPALTSLPGPTAHGLTAKPNFSARFTMKCTQSVAAALPW